MDILLSTLAFIIKALVVAFLFNVALNLYEASYRRRIQIEQQEQIKFLDALLQKALSLPKQSDAMDILNTALKSKVN